MNTLHKLSFALAAILASAGLCFGQTAMTQTTLSFAVDSKTVTIPLASLTNVLAPGLPTSQGGIGSNSGTPAVSALFLDQEEMRIAGTTGTAALVERGYNGTVQRPHNAGVVVFVGPASSFGSTEPSGACVRTLLGYVPLVVTTGNLFDCVNGQYASFTVGPVVEGAAIASAATIAPLGVQTPVSGVVTIETITAPPAMPATGCLTLIPTGLWSTGLTGNIAIASTGVVDKALTMCYSPSLAKWVPSY